MSAIGHCRALLAVAVVASSAMFGQVAAASADEWRALPADKPASADGSVLDRIEEIDDRQLNMYVYSAAMEKVILLEVIRPADTSVPRPTLYLLNGAGGGEDSQPGRRGPTSSTSSPTRTSTSSLPSAGRTATTPTGKSPIPSSA